MAGAVVWRIARQSHALDASGTGAREHGGRWNQPGTAVIYAACSIAIAALEKLVHLAGVIPGDLVLVRIDLPDSHSSEKPSRSDLPNGWDVIPPGAESMEFGTRWAREARSLVLYVPSVIVPEECNAVLNPAHPEFRGVRMTLDRDFRFDARIAGGAPRVA